MTWFQGQVKQAVRPYCNQARQVFQQIVREVYGVGNEHGMTEIFEKLDLKSQLC